VSLANYSGGNNNSVIVTASASRELPFSSFLTGEGATVSVYAQASYEEGVTFTSCLIATDEDDDGAITIGGSSVLTAGCGMAALSTSESSITVNGNPDIDAGWILSKGGIDDWLKTNTDDDIHEYMNGLYDPFEDFSPPNPAESRSHGPTRALRAGPRRRQPSLLRLRPSIPTGGARTPTARRATITQAPSRIRPLQVRKTMLP
jgi:hypothetical protein